MVYQISLEMPEFYKKDVTRKRFGLFFFLDTLYFIWSQKQKVINNKCRLIPEMVYQISLELPEFYKKELHKNVLVSFFLDTLYFIWSQKQKVITV